MLADRVIERLWERMGEIYGHRWPSSYGDDALKGAGRTWAKGLAGITPDQVADGISACMASAEPWPPTLPEFRGMCLGIPSLGTVRQELRAEQGRSRFTLEVWSRIDGWRFRQADAEQAGRLIRDAYEAAREHVMLGGALPELPVAALEGAGSSAEPPPKARPEVVEQAVEAVRRVLGQPTVEVDEDVGEIDTGEPA